MTTAMTPQERELALQEQRHHNPDGTVVRIFVHPSATIGAYATIGHGAKIGAFATIVDDATIGDHAYIGDGATVGAFASIGSGAVIGNGATVEEDALIGDGAAIGAGDSLRWFSGFYPCEAYRSADGSPVLRHGCETLPLVDWTPKRQAELCEKHKAGPEVARTLAHAVAVAQAFFAGQQRQ